MEIKIETKQILKVLYILSCILFVGICVDAGGIVSNAIYTLFFNPALAGHFWQKVDLSGLYQLNPSYFFVQTFLMSIVAMAKACIFYLIVMILHNKKINMSQPFSFEVGRFIFSLAYLTLITGLSSFFGVKFVEWCTTRGVNMPDIRSLGLGGADVWLFMSVVLFVLAQVFKRGVEIQSENDLTI